MHASSLTGSRSRILAVAAAGLLLPAVIAGCGSSSKGSGGTSSSASTSPSTSVSAPASAFPGTVASGAPVKIGVINPSGGPAVSQPEDAKAAQAAADYANANLGGIGGHPVQIDLCSEKEDTATATACANQMVSDKVAAVVVTTTGFGDTINPIITGAGIPYVTISGASADELTGKDTFDFTGGFPGILIDMAKYSAGKQYKSVTAFVTDSPAAIGGAKALGVPAFKAAGITLNVVGIPLGAPDVTSQVTSGTTSNPAGVIVVGDSTVCTSVLKALQTIGSKADRLVIQPCLDPSVVESVGSELAGSHVFTQQLTSGTTPETATFLAVMAKYASGTPTQGYASVGYTGVLALIRAANAGKVTDPTAATLIAALQASSAVPVPAADGLTFTCNGKQLPGLSAVCGSSAIEGTATAQGDLTDTTVIQ